MRYADEAAPGDALSDPHTSRRSFLRSTSAGVTSVALGASVAASAGSPPAHAADTDASDPAARRGTRPLAVTPACSGQETPASIEGPLFKPRSPARSDLITPAIRGVRLDLSGVVYDTACKPLPETLIEFWQCDQNGDYDTSGFSLRGHQYTDSRGAYRLRTIIPRDYWGRWGQRAPHIHTQVQASGGPVLITQLYFPDDTQAYGRDFTALNAADRLLNRACTIRLTGPENDRYAGTFDFVITTTVQAAPRTV
ncbi:dioxygenase [Streptomyces sp. NPDC048483]|uniref:dioxygenase family protein n=1 Tax=Streptomyces sp. NPDC048483 TaxID=3154927 RepID=UPI0034397C5B